MQKEKKKFFKVAERWPNHKQALKRYYKRQKRQQNKIEAQ